MARNGAGTYERAVASYVAGTTIDQTVVNQEMDDIATALTGSIAKNGETVPTANLPMGTYRHTGVGNGSARTDYAAMGQVQDGKVNWVDGGGTADAITATYSPAITALVDGQLCHVRATAANATTTPTFSPNSLTARTIVKNGGVALAAGDIVGDGHELILRYDLANTRWELLNPAPDLSAYQPLDADLTAIAALDKTDGNIIVGDGSAWVAESGATARTSLGIVAASATSAGLVELATTAEAAAGTDTERAITPAGLFGGLNATGTAPVYACRAWVNFNGTGTVAINASGNVSSITDNGTGDYTINFATALPDADYSVSGSAQLNGSSANGDFNTFVSLNRVPASALSTSSVRIFTNDTRDGSLGADCLKVCVAVFR